MLHLENLSSQALNKGILPWDFKPAEPLPEQIRTDKKFRDAWINHPDTKHHVYTFSEGVNPNLRISKARKDGEGNPIHSTHALVADYDAAQDEANVIKLAKALPIVPNWIEKTLSGHWRFIWLLAVPLLFPSFDFSKHFFKRFKDFAFDPAMGMIGFDAGAWEAPERLYTNSCDWRFIHDVPVSKDTVRGWLVQASQSFKFSNADLGIKIPLEIVKPELARLFPRFNQWPTDFTLDSQGPTFWVDGSESPKSAIVREAGIQTFSAHAAKAFYSWLDLLGAAFCRKYETEAIGKAVEGIHYDGKHFHTQNPAGIWFHSERVDIQLHLRTTRGVNPKPDKSGKSEVDLCLEYVRNHQRVAGAAPFPLRRPGLIHIKGVPYLNTNSRKIVAAADGKGIWGPNGNFAWLSQFLGVLFSSPEQLDYLVSWSSVLYKSAHFFEPCSGQALFIAGPTGVGKTLLGYILGVLMGGGVDASDYLNGKDGFGAELFESIIWNVDDSVSAADNRTQRVFSEMVKRMAANSSFRFNAKFRQALLVEWLGRVIVTLNCDEESIRKLPDLDISIIDKVMLFRTANSTITFPSRKEIDEILTRELPFFARFLLDYSIPQHCLGSARYQVACYHEPSLVEIARQSSRTAGFAEILEDWKTSYFHLREKNAAFWEGTAYQLQKEILLDPTAESAMRSFTVDAIGRHLSALKNKGMHVECESQGTSRIWRIHRAQFQDEPQTNNT